MRPLTIKNPQTAIQALLNEIRRSEESRYDHRLHAALLVAQGLSAREVAALLGDAARTVELWVHRFEKNNLGGLREGRRSGRPSRLNQEQIVRAQMALRSTPAEVGLRVNTWDANTLSDYLRTLGVRLQPRQCRNLLHRWRLEDTEYHA